MALHASSVFVSLIRCKSEALKKVVLQNHHYKCFKIVKDRLVTRFTIY